MKGLATQKASLTWQLVSDGLALSVADAISGLINWGEGLGRFYRGFSFFLDSHIESGIYLTSVSGTVKKTNLICSSGGLRAISP